MGWKGNLRSLAAYSRKLERESIRRRNAIAKRQKEVAKMQELQAAAHAVEEYENYIELIQTTHKEEPDTYDWLAVSNTPQPKEPKKATVKSDKFTRKLEKFKPNIFHRIFKREEKAKIRLGEKIKKAQAKEQLIHDKNISEWQVKFKEWQEMVNTAKGILAGDVVSYKNAVTELNPLEEFATIGSSVRLNFHSKNLVEVTIVAHNDEVVPKYQKSLLKSGKLSVKDLPESKRNEIYQDHICSAVLRVGRELFSLLPVEYIAVNAESNLLDSATGKLVPQIILSVLLVRETMSNLNFDLIDPSDSMKNFKCNMNFKKAQGMSPVVAVDISNIK